MDAAALNEIGVIIQAVQTGGTIALLILAVYAFQTGRIISKATLDSILEAYTAKVVEMFKKEFDDIKEEVRKLQDTGRRW